MHASFGLHFEAIGTIWTVEVYEVVPEMLQGQLETAIRERIDEFDACYSRFRPDSLVSLMAREAGTYQLPADARILVDLYRDLYGVTSGAVTPLIGQVLADAGYDANYSFTSRPLTPPPAWEAVLNYQFPRLTLAQPALLDFGAAGKGYLVDLVAAILEDAGITAYCVDAGGDLRYRHPATQPLRVGLEHPADPTQVIGVAEIQNVSLCGSAGNRRAWGEYHHIMDPVALGSPHHLQAVWVTAGTTLLADALTTALFFVSPHQLHKHYNFEYALIRASGSLEFSSRFPATFFTAPDPSSA